MMFLLGAVIGLLAGALTVQQIQRRRDRETKQRDELLVGRIDAAEARYEELVGALPRVYFEADPATLQFERVSDACESVLGFSSDRLMRELDWSALLHPDDVDLLNEAVEQATRTGVAVSREVRVRRADGAEAPMRLRLWSPRRTSGRRVLCGLLGDGGGPALGEGDPLNRSTAARLRHESRLLLDGIVTPIRLMKLGQLSDRQREFAEIAMSSAEGLLTLVDGLDDLSRMQEGSLELKSRAFELPALLSRITSVAQGRAQHRNIELTSEQADDLPRFVTGDPDRVREVLMNLVSNAIKFTDEGEVRLSARTVSTEEDEVRIRFEVSDTGRGIHPDDRERIFDPFVRSLDGNGRQTHGTGLGLTICRQLVDYMGGDLQLMSELGTGTTFRFELPFSLPTRQVSDSEVGRPTAQPIPPLHILLVEDNPISSKVFRFTLERRGHTVIPVMDGRAAVETAKREQELDLIFMDCQLPVLDGYAATKAIRENESGRRVPIVALTASVMPGERERCLAAGMDEFLSKPVEPDRLDAVLRRWWKPVAERAVEPTEEAEPTTGEPGPGSEPAMDEAPVDWSVLEALTELDPEGGPEAVRDMLSFFVECSDRDLAAVRDAVEASDPEALTKTAHYLKGNCLSLGAMAAADVCAELESAGRTAEIDIAAESLGELDRLLAVTKNEFRKRIQEMR